MKSSVFVVAHLTKSDSNVHPRPPKVCLWCGCRDPLTDGIWCEDFSPVGIGLKSANIFEGLRENFVRCNDPLADVVAVHES